jgi:hypothetical protein
MTTKLDKLFHKAIKSAKRNTFSRKAKAHGVETQTINVYTLDELSPKAREKAITDQRHHLSENYDAEFMEDFFKEKLEENGLPTDDIRWSLSRLQGDGVAFYGSVDVAEYLKKNKLLTTFVGLKRVLKDISVEISPRNHRYNHWNSMGVNIECREELNAIQEGLIDRLKSYIEQSCREVSRELEKIGYDCIEGDTSEEAAIESIHANEYRFLENGELNRF